MAVRDFIRPQWLHILLAVVGFLTLFAMVIVAVVVITTLIYIILFVVIGVLVGASVGSIIDSLSISIVTQVAFDHSYDLYTLFAGTLFFIVLLPYFVSYNRWLGRILYDRGSDTDSEY